MIKFTLNGEAKEYDGDPTTTLLTYLREHEGIISAKDGCAPQAACGCCVVQENGRAVLSCARPMSKVSGSEITTIEGLGEYRQEIFANSFVACGGVQCGFCIPGIVMQSNVLINKNPEPNAFPNAKVNAKNSVLTIGGCQCVTFKDE